MARGAIGRNSNTGRQSSIGLTSLAKTLGQVVTATAVLLMPATLMARTIYAFPGNGHGAKPFYAGVTFDASGSLYGTAIFTNALYNQGSPGFGVVYKLDSSGKETVLYTFTGGTDGAYPEGGVTVDAQGNLYGTTSSGGDTSCSVAQGGCGVVFELSPKGTETVLHAFTGGADGAVPEYANLLMDSKGNLYGVTQAGGNQTGPCSSGGCGGVFEIASNGTFSSLHDFSGKDGAYPSATLTLDASGNLYGTTLVGGRSRGNGCGVLFKINIKTGHETILHKFNGPDGCYSFGQVVFDSVGNLYGAPFGGGDYTVCADGCGTAFRIDPTGKFRTLHIFEHGGTDGYHPQGSLAVDASGNVYGATLYGGGPGDGTVFKLDHKGNETIVHTFGLKNQAPTAGVVFDAAMKNLYGATVLGGHLNCDQGYGCGSVFEIAP